LRTTAPVFFSRRLVELLIERVEAMSSNQPSQAAAANAAVVELAMRRAIELAALGPAFGANPRVGAVILDSTGQIIAEGWHRGAGTAHAEVDALAKIQNLRDDNGKLPAGLTAVVTLEPCNHTGRTGPCSQALIDAGISRVVFAAADPGRESANGAANLRAAGIRVESGLMAAESEELNRVWFTSMRNQRPFVTLKWATSIDGRAAAADGTSKWISVPESRAESHLRRSNVDAILIGTGTALADDPELTARKPDGSLYEHQPLRVIVGERELPNNLRIFNADAETAVFKTHSLNSVLDDLFKRGVRHVWVEGGPSVASRFVAENLVDEYIVYLAPMLIGGPRTALADIGVGNIAEAKHLRVLETKQLGQDIFIRATTKEA
jgi:diaminohydroxyphosphoribosylaminopyrimidine deaminase/5-amino-6-(5-phosphoribosylamino)uracil reductase